MFSVKDKEPTPAIKRTIKIKNLSLKDSKFVDDSGDITNKIIEALPEGIENIDFRFTITLDGDDE